MAKLTKLKSPPTKQGWYWCCEGYSPSAMYVCWVSTYGGYNEHELTYGEAAYLEADWWGPIQSPEDPQYYGDKQ